MTVRRYPRLRYYGVRIAAAFVFGVAAIMVALPLTSRVLRPALLDYAIARLNDRDRKELYDRIASHSSGLFDAIPEAQVSRLAKPYLTTLDFEAPVVTNNAGLRAGREYTPKLPGHFRIVCLGDSFVFGTAGLQQDRFCDQIAEFYAAHRVQVSGQPIETYALGIGGWNAVQEATYLSSRISAYDPDVIVMLTVENDLMDSYGVTGFGGMTTDFTSEYRDRGSAFFSSQAGADFGEWDSTALNSGLGPEAEGRWAKVMTGLKRLSDLQHRRDKKILFSVLRFYDWYFADLYQHYFNAQRIPDPMLVTSFFLSPETHLAHDSHPNRLGHSILASHYINKLSALGWIPVPTADMPTLHEGLSLEPPVADRKRLAKYRQQYASGFLRTTLNFERLNKTDVKAFLGGIFPERRGPEGLDEAPWATVRSGFLLRRPAQARAVDIQIRIAPLVELFPFEVRLSIDGGPASVIRFDRPLDSGLYDLSAPVPSGVSADEEPAIELMLETSSYFTQIGDHRMKSFRLLSARVR